MTLPSPATGTELYLAAILGELRALRAAVEGGGQELAHEPGAEPAAAVSSQPESPTKRTRTRASR